MRILSIDFEATNKDPRRGCPIQLGVAVMEGLNVEAYDQWLIRPPVHYKTGKPTREVDAYALRVSGLTLETIEGGMSSTEACEHLEAFVRANHAGSLPNVAYQASYDMECLSSLLYEGGSYNWSTREYAGYGEILSHKWMCVYRLARKKLAGVLASFTLDDVAGHIGLARETKSHEAVGDAILCGEVLHYLTATDSTRRVST